jgi:hypothetical protein
MNTNEFLTVIGFEPPSEEWLKMRDAGAACKAAGVPIPDAILQFFKGAEPEDDGVRVVLNDAVLTPWEGDTGEGYEIDLKALKKAHPGVKKLRVVVPYAEDDTPDLPDADQTDEEEETNETDKTDETNPSAESTDAH